MTKEFNTFRDAADYARQLASEAKCTSRLVRAGDKWLVSALQIDKPDLTEGPATAISPTDEIPEPQPTAKLSHEQEWEEFWRLAARVEEGRGGTRAEVAQAFSHLIRSDNPSALLMQKELLKADATDPFNAIKYSSKTLFGRGPFSLAYLVSGSFGSKYDFGQGPQ